MKNPRVGIVMGSESDLSVMEEAVKVLEKLGIDCEITVSSAHRSPERTARYAREARDRGLEVIVAGAGAAAHLAGVIASETTLPVIGVPIDSSPLKGFDALLSTVQMPGGIPVATMAVGSAGARNAGVFAAQILALKDPSLQKNLDEYREELAAKVEKQAEKVSRKEKK